MTTQRVMVFGGLALLVAVVGMLFWRMTHPAGAGTAVVAAAPTAEERRLDAAVKTLEALCLSNVGTTSKDNVVAGLKARITGIGANASAERIDQVVRGAASDLPAADRTREGEAIRACLTANFDKVLAAMSPEKTAQVYPDPLDARFALSFPEDDPQVAPADIVAHLRAGRRIIDGEVLARQTPGYYLLRLPYPGASDVYTGNISRAVLRETKNARVPKSLLCFRRPAKAATVPDVFVKFDCADGKPCTLDDMSPAWVETCPAETAFDWSFGLVGTARAEPVARQWSVPSRRTWDRLRPTLKGVGYTAFDVGTDAFSGTGAYGVEVALAVNGVAVEEDGLEPAARPVKYAGTGRFAYGFGLRSLDLQGSNGGCDRIELTLTSVGARGGEKSLTVGRDYVVLRDLPPARVGAVEWRGRYQRPVDAYEHEVFLTSLRYAASLAADGPAVAARREAVRAQALREKARFDALGLRYAGQPLKAVIRPPLRDAAFGLAVGTIAAGTGQFRFTFDLPEAKAIKATVLAARAAPAARRIIDPGVFVYRVANGGPGTAATPPGACPPRSAQA